MQADMLCDQILNAMATGVRYNASNVVKLLGGRGIHPERQRIVNALKQLTAGGKIKKIPSYKTAYFIK